MNYNLCEMNICTMCINEFVNCSELMILTSFLVFSLFLILYWNFICKIFDAILALLIIVITILFNCIVELIKFVINHIITPFWETINIISMKLFDIITQINLLILYIIDVLMDILYDLIINKLLIIFIDWGFKLIAWIIEQLTILFAIFKYYLWIPFLLLIAAD
jgi:hypothetical protein